MAENKRRRRRPPPPPPPPGQPTLADLLAQSPSLAELSARQYADLEAADRAARLEWVQVDVPDWVQAAAPPGWTAFQQGVEDTKMWKVCAGGSDGEWMMIAKCQECGAVEQTPSGRGAAPSEHAGEHWIHAFFEWDHGGIYCGEACMRRAMMLLGAWRGVYR